MTKTTSELDAPSERIFAVIDCLVRARAPLTVTDIAQALDLPAPTVHRIARQLADRGYLKRALGAKSFLPGRRLVALGMEIVGAAFAADRPRDILVGLARRLDAHCHVGVVVDDEVVYVDAARMTRPGLQFEPGGSAPVHATSIGKLHLAQLKPDALAQLLAAMPLRRFTATTICEPAALLAELQRVRKRGWASSNAEFTPGVVGCAVPIVDARGRMIAGLGLSAPAANVAFSTLRQYVPAMQEAARQICDLVLEDAERAPRVRIA
ncbi:IclR family transcriptional regulator [Xanthobacter sp. KR7-225]|uniref:IclR family transcriptional regulator n=1 Tax=Xanthobacter sp. KR7-225 TaxID=3156613 RepID=UPI0032B326D4